MKYRYIGGGMGVPGLPHEISDEEANERGLDELLKAAVENGSYVSVETEEISASTIALREG